MYKKYYSLFLLLLIAQSIATTYTNPYSVDVGDIFFYTIEDQGDKGTITVKVEEIVNVGTELVDQPKTVTTIEGAIKGEYYGDGTPIEAKYGWRALLYVDIKVSISFDNFGSSLHSMIYENEYPIVWPFDDEFYEKFELKGASHDNSISTEKKGNTWIITERFDDTAFDGCLCETIIALENGILTSLFQNETNYFTINGPSVKTTYVTQEKTELLITEDVELPYPVTFALSAFFPIFLKRKSKSPMRNERHQS